MPAVGQPGYDPIFKVRPYIDLLNTKFKSIWMPETLCVDEMMIPYDGTRGPRHYVKGKPHPWGYKAFTLCDSKGIVYNVDIACGASPQQPGFPDIGSTGNMVLKLCSIIPVNQSHKVYMDNYFSSIPLFYELLANGIHTMGTVRLDRLAGISNVIISDSDLQNKGIRAFREYEAVLPPKVEDLRVI